MNTIILRVIMKAAAAAAAVAEAPAPAALPAISTEIHQNNQKDRSNHLHRGRRIQTER